MNILVNIYACNPYWGSEPGLGWNWVKFLGKHCILHVITEGEWHENIEKELKLLPYANNIHFYYLPVSERIRRMCWNQGDWRFYKHYKIWQYRAYEKAIEIINSEKIDVIHQLNMQGFREPGYLWKIKNIPFVWGPIGGMNLLPERYLRLQNPKKLIFYTLKNIINRFQIKHHSRVIKAIERTNLLLSSTPDEVKALQKYHNKKSLHIPDTGTFVSNKENKLDRFDGNFLKIVWVGKFDFRKQLDIALEAISKIDPNLKVFLHIVGTGTEKQVATYKKLATSLKIEKKIIWHGMIDNQAVLKLMSESQLFFFTSISEATSTVVLEAISNQLPVLCFDLCGFGPIIDETIGRKIQPSNAHQSSTEFANEIEFLYNNSNLLREMSENCNEKLLELSWDRKAEKMIELYNRIISNES